MASDLSQFHTITIKCLCDSFFTPKWKQMKTKTQTRGLGSEGTWTRPPNLHCEVIGLNDVNVFAFVEIWIVFNVHWLFSVYLTRYIRNDSVTLCRPSRTTDLRQQHVRQHRCSEELQNVFNTVCLCVCVCVCVCASRILFKCGATSNMLLKINELYHNTGGSLMICVHICCQVFRGRDLNGYTMYETLKQIQPAAGEAKIKYFFYKWKKSWPQESFSSPPVASVSTLLLYILYIHTYIHIHIHIYIYTYIYIY